MKKLNFGCGMEIMLQKRWETGRDQLGEKHSSQARSDSGLGLEPGGVLEKIVDSGYTILG